MNKTQIALKYAKALPLKKGAEKNDALATSLSAEMMQLGFVPTKRLYNILTTLSDDQLAELSAEMLPALKKAVGADVKHKPFYPNFPKQVMEASHLELFINAITHYYSKGEWRPDYEELPRDFHFEDVTFKEIDITTEKGFSKIFVRLLTSTDSISKTDKEAVSWFIDNTEVLPNVDIPFKENLCYVAGIMLEKGKDISSFVSTATDVLRIATHLSEGDISLAGKTKFKSLPRKTRRILVGALEKVIRAEDIKRHKNKWIRLFHSLHVGDFSQKVFDVAKKVRNNETIQTFNTKVEAAITGKKVDAALALLVTRPGEFARRIDHLLRLTSTTNKIVDAFLTVADEVPTRIILQLYGNLKVRHQSLDKRIVFPKGSTQKAQIIPGVPSLSVTTVKKLRSGIQKSLLKRFRQHKKLGKVYIDPLLVDCPLPTQQRSASEGLFQVARGTALPMGDKNTLRCFVYWKGEDIDLSATIHDEKFNMIEQISYTNLKSQCYEACHSGDITSAPRGASEFIDITIDQAIEHGARYVIMNVFVYSGEPFAEHKECFAGWMTRSEPNSNEIFHPKTVVQKIDLRGDTKNCIPVIFDLVERKAICVDLATKRSYGDGMFGSTRFGGNNVESNRASIQETLEVMTSINNKTTLHELMTLHAEARGKIVADKDKADVVFSLHEGITPYDVTEINSEYVV